MSFAQFNVVINSLSGILLRGSIEARQIMNDNQLAEDTKIIVNDNQINSQHKIITNDKFTGDIDFDRLLYDILILIACYKC